MAIKLHRWISLPVVIACTLLQGCSVAPVAAWEKSTLAQPGMSFEEDPAMTGFDEHFYFSKEASSGGRGFSGGGCGCN
jgi:hypothetical protein